MDARMDTAGARGFLVTDAIILKRAGHELEPILRLNREDMTNFFNNVAVGNGSPPSDEIMVAMNEIRNYVNENISMYLTTVAEFAGEEKEFRGINTSGEDQYSVDFSDNIVFKRLANDLRQAYEMTAENRIRLINSVTLTEQRVRLIPQSCQDAVIALRDIVEQRSKRIS